MKIICTQENLKNGLATVGRIVSSSNTLPILSHVLLKAENGLLEISSTNLEIAITTQVRCKVEEQGSLTVSGKVFSDLINNLPNKNITITLAGTDMSIEADNYHTNLKTLPAEDFPLIPSLDNHIKTSLDSQGLKQAIDQVVFACSTNQTQPEITGVLFVFERNKFKLAATDRYRLAEKTLTLPVESSKTQELIIPHKTVVELSRVVGLKKGMVDVLIGETQVGFVFEETKIVSRLVDGQYPDYKQIIPTNFNTEILVDKQALVSALKAASIFSQVGNSVRVEYGVDSQKLTLTTESQEVGKSVVDLESEIDGDKGAIVLNHRYVLDFLSSVNTEKVRMKILNDNSPSLMVPEGDETYLYLVMPIKS